MTDGPGKAGISQRDFYASDPSDYFRDRLSMLAVRAGASSRLAALAAEGVAWGPIRLASTPLDDVTGPGPGEPDTTAGSISIETRALLREVSTALIVHFLAHADPDVHPWSEAPRLLRSHDWTARLVDLAAEEPQDSLLAGVAEVFLGGVRSVPTPAWLEARGASARLLGVVARRHVVGDAASTLTALGLTAPRPAAGADPATEDAEEANQDLAWLIHLANNQLRVLWKVARQRHLGIIHDGLDLVTDAAVDALAPTEPRP